MTCSAESASGGASGTLCSNDRRCLLSSLSYMYHTCTVQYSVVKVHTVPMPPFPTITITQTAIQLFLRFYSALAAPPRAALCCRAASPSLQQHFGLYPAKHEPRLPTIPTAQCPLPHSTPPSHHLSSSDSPSHCFPFPPVFSLISPGPAFVPPRSNSLQLIRPTLYLSHLHKTPSTSTYISILLSSAPILCQSNSHTTISPTHPLA